MVDSVIGRFERGKNPFDVNAGEVTGNSRVGRNWARLLPRRWSRSTGCFVTCPRRSKSTVCLTEINIDVCGVCLPGVMREGVVLCVAAALPLAPKAPVLAHRITSGAPRSARAHAAALPPAARAAPHATA
ncbi:hypothetical protein EVAR_16077_1 [Eumeta japonica]|uniref:Uncharacterized protein n=1 Tax=Eumeta variegata TaxID=151549 RepID=A0A4C1UJU1_EUMVA|nr:hypothetical protein EVAR_16077_1 [Eumeta japonica]